MRKLLMIICFGCFLITILAIRDVDINENKEIVHTFNISNYYNELLEYEDEIDKIGFEYYDQYLIRRFIKHSKKINVEKVDENIKYTYEILNKNIDEVVNKNVNNKDEVNYLYIYTDSNNNLVKVTYDFSNYIDEYTNSDKFNADIYFKVKDEESNIN